MTRPAPTSSAFSTSPPATRAATPSSTSSRAPPNTASCRSPSAAASASSRISASSCSPGADKVSINTAAVNDPDFVARAADKFGNQCIVVSVDARRRQTRRPAATIVDEWEIFTHGGRTPTGIDAVEFAVRLVERGAGELLVTSMDRDGTKSGFDLELTRAIADAVHVPVIASGGVGSLDDLVDGVKQGHASAVLAASIFHFGTFTIAEAKAHLLNNGVAVQERAWGTPHGIYARTPERTARRARQAPRPMRATPPGSWRAASKSVRRSSARKRLKPPSPPSRSDRKGLVGEAGDVLYHLLVLLRASGVELDEVMAELETRTAQSGLAEKAARGVKQLMARPPLELPPLSPLHQGRMG